MVAQRKNQTNIYYWLRTALPYIVFLLLIVTSCGKPSAPQQPTISNPVQRPLIAIDAEIDTEPLYSLGHTVASAFAQKIEELATRINSQGLVIFACRISSNSWQDCPISFKTPSVSAWVLPPSDPAAHCPPDPYQCSRLKKQYDKDLAAWKVVHANQVRALEQTRSSVHSLSLKIKNMFLQWDNRGSDIYGALATCAANLQGINTPYKFCVLATDFISTTQQSGSLSLAGVRVVAAFHTCSDNAFCQQSTAYWSNVARRAGAVSFTTYSVSQSQAFGLQLPDMPA